MRGIAVLVVALGVATMSGLAPPAAHASLPSKTIVLLGGIAREFGETHWEVLKDQLTQRGFPESNLLEFSYAGGSFTPDGGWLPNPSGDCDTFSKTSILKLGQMFADMRQVRPDHEIFLVGYDVGGFVATQALWLAASGRDDPTVWQNLSGIASIDGEMSGLGRERSTALYAAAGALGCIDNSMVTWIQEVGSEPNRYAANEARAAQVMAFGYKIGSFGNTLDCFYKYISDDICPKLNKKGIAGHILPLLPDERPTQFIKNGTIYREYNFGLDFPDEYVDNHRAVLMSAAPMAEVADFLVSQTR